MQASGKPVLGKVGVPQGLATILSTNPVLGNMMTNQNSCPVIRAGPNLKRKVGLSQFIKNRGLGDADPDMTSRQQPPPQKAIITAAV